MHDCDIIAVIKADAYGHGDCQAAHSLMEAGCRHFAVSNIVEAAALRRSGIVGDILVLGYSEPSLAEAISDLGLVQIVYSYEYAHLLHQQAKKCGRVLPVHLKIDTGMGRLGFRPDSTNCQKEIKEIQALPYFNVTGCLTHFAGAEKEYTHMQAKLFSKAYGYMGSLVPLCRHCCNSITALRFPEYHYDMVRLGILLYGIPPCPCKLELREAMAVKSIIAQVKEIPKGASISYDSTFTANEPIRVAAVKVGYADGYPRSLSNKGIMYVQNSAARVLGRVTMDQTIIDITNIDCALGDEVTVFGQGGESIATLAKKADCLAYEIICGISARVPRIYIK